MYFELEKIAAFRWEIQKTRKFIKKKHETKPKRMHRREYKENYEDIAAHFHETFLLRKVDQKRLLQIRFCLYRRTIITLD